MTNVGPHKLAHLVRDFDPSRRNDGTDESPGVITEAEKPGVRIAIDARLADIEPRARLGGDGVQRHIRQLHDLRSALDAPGDFDVRSRVYRGAQEAGLPVSAIEGRIPDYHLSPDELRSAIDGGIQRAASLDRELRAARGKTPPDEALVARLAPALAAASDEVTRLRQHRVLSLVEDASLPPGVPVDVTTRGGLVTLREHLDTEIGRWRRMDDPGVVELLARDPGAVLARQRLLAAARSEVSMTLGGPDAMAQAVFDATWARPGTDERAAQIALAQIHASGAKAPAEAELHRLLLVHGVEVPDGADFPAIRHTIASEMGWVDRRVAESMFTEGRDVSNTPEWEYFLHALTKPFDSAFDFAVDNPGHAAAIAGGAVVAGATLPLSLLAAAGLGYGLFEMGGGAHDYTTAGNRDERTEAIYRVGGGVTTALPAAGVGLRTLRTAAPRVAAVDELPNGVDPRGFLARNLARMSGAVARHVDSGRFPFADEAPKLVYRASYYAPNGRVSAYATTDYGTAAAFQRANPGSLLYTGHATDAAEAQVISGAARTGRAFLVTGYRWTVAQ